MEADKGENSDRGRGAGRSRRSWATRPWPPLPMSGRDSSRNGLDLRTALVIVEGSESAEPNDDELKEFSEKRAGAPRAPGTRATSRAMAPSDLVPRPRRRTGRFPSRTAASATWRQPGEAGALPRGPGPARGARRHRGHGRSTSDSRPFLVREMASDVLAAADALGIRAGPRGFAWSDGRCTALSSPGGDPSRVSGSSSSAATRTRAEQGDRLLQPAPRPVPAQEGPAPRCRPRRRPDARRRGGARRRGPSRTTSGVRPGAGSGFPSRSSRPGMTSSSVPEHADTCVGRSRGWSGLLPGVSHFAPLQRPALTPQLCGVHFLERTQ